MKRGFLLLIILGAITAPAQYSQRSRQRQELSFYYEFSQALYLEGVNLAADDPALSRVEMNFRIGYDALTFQKPTVDRPGESPFTAVLVMRAELLDERDVTVQRTSWRDTVRVQTYFETNDKFRFIIGAMSFDAPPGAYTLILTAEDGATRNVLRELRSRVRLRDFHKPLQCSQPLILARPDSGYVRPMSLGGNVEFGTPSSIHLDVMSTLGPPSVRYALMRLKGGDSTMFAQGAMSLARGMRIELAGGRCCAIQQTADSSRYACRVDVNGDSLDLGDYTLHIIVIAGTDTISSVFPFHVVWSTMPLSLAETDYAIEAMKYILTDSQLDSMKDGNTAERRKHFDAYWAAHDPTPGTVFNERKAEYFRRVDEAYFTFRNPAREDDDGMRTDRGKILILFGKPSSVQRVLLPDGPAQETWTYTNNVHKRFVFVDAEKSGGYRLTEVKELP